MYGHINYWLTQSYIFYANLAIIICVDVANFVFQYFVFTNADAYNFQKVKELEYITQFLFLAMIHKLIKMQIGLHVSRCKLKYFCSINFQFANHKYEELHTINLSHTARARLCEYSKFNCTDHYLSWIWCNISFISRT